jgi:dTDP-4-amino-4,6-dideoxygalactose transaminase
MLVTKDDSLAHQISRQRAFGVDRTIGERSEPGIYDVTMLGFNYRMNEIEAAIGIEQIKRMPAFLAAREQNHRVLTKQLRDVDEIRLLDSTNGHFKSGYYCCSVILNDTLTVSRPAIVQHMKQQGIGTSVYYPRPVPLLSYYRQKYGHAAAEFPVATRLSESSIALPVGPHLTCEDMGYVAQTLKDAIASVSNR